MGKRNQITADLRIQADAQLKNSSAFIKQLERMTDKFDFGDKMNKQILDAQEQLKGYNKVLEKIKGKSVISDDELKNLVKAGKEIANVITKTEKLYSGMSTSELQKYSKAYIAQVKAQEEAALKIKQDYFNKTGKVYDKEIKNLDKYENKIVDLQKQIKTLNDSKDDTIDAAIKRENTRLQEQFDLLQKIKKTQAELKNSKDNIYAESSASTGFSEKELKSKVNTNKADVAKDVANSEYKNLLNTYQAISKEKDEILKSTTDTLAVEQALIQLATQYGLANVKTTEEFNEQLAALEKQKNFYRLLQNRGQLATEEKVTAEIERRNALLREQQRIAQAIVDAQGDILVDNGFDSTKQMNSQARNAKEVLNGKNVQLTVDGASLTESGEDDIATQISNSIKQNVDRLIGEEKQVREEVNDLNETNNKLATQSERSADEGDIKDAINAGESQQNQTRGTIKDSESKINATTIKSDKDIAFDIIREYNKEEIKSNAQGITKSFDLLTDTTKFDDETIEMNKQLLNNQVEIVTTQFEKVVDGIVENTEDFDKAAKDMIANLQSIIPVLEEEYQAREQATDANIASHIRKYGGSSNPHQKQALELAVQGEKNSLSRDKQEIDQAIEKTKRLISIVEKLQKKAKENNDGISLIGESASSAATKIGKAAQQSQYLSSTFDDIKNKVGYFLSLNYIFDTMTQKIREAVQTTREMDKDMTQIGLVLGKTSTQVWKSFNTYSEMAARLNTTTSEVTQSMKLFYQQGLNTTEVNKMVEASAVAAALGESTMAEASETLTSILNSYNLSAHQAMEVTDKISQIAIVSAADFGELSTAIEKVASSAASAGLDLDHMMGYLAKMIETTREAPTNIGTALKTIVANFTQFKEDPTGLGEEGTEINKVDKALKSVGISLTDTNDEVRDLSEVIDELGTKWENLTRNQKSYLATAIAGTRQQSRFYALMNDYERTLELVAEGSNSAGKAQQQFALYSNSLEAATNRLTNQWEKFFNSITQGNGLIANTTNILTTLMKIVNAIGPIGTILGIGSLTSSLRKSINWFSTFNEKIKESESITQTYQQTLENIDNNSKLNKKQKKEQKKNAEAKYNEQQFDNQSFFKELGKDAEKYKTRLEEINIKQEKWIEEIDNSEKHFKGLRKTGVKTISSLKKGFSGLPLVFKQIGAALVSLASKFAIMLAIQASLKLISAGFSALKSSLNINTEAYIENAEKAQENADNVNQLVDEYEELSKKINLTTEEQERLKEITEEITKVDASLGRQLKENANNYTANVQAMREYVDLQEKIAAQETAKAVRSEASLMNNLFAILDPDVWTSWVGSESDKQNLTSEQQNNWRELSTARGQQYGLTDEQTAMLDRYAEELIQIQADNGWDSLDYKYNTGEFDSMIIEFIEGLSKLTEAQQQSYTDFVTELNAGDLNYHQLMTQWTNLDLPMEIKSSLFDQIQDILESIKKQIDNNTFIKNKDTAYSNVLSYMSISDANKLFNPDTSTFTEQEKEIYKADLAKFVEDTSLLEKYQQAQLKGSEALKAFSSELSKGGQYTQLFTQSIYSAAQALSSEEFVKAIDNILKLGEMNINDIMKGGASQLDIIEALGTGVIDFNDIIMTEGGTISVSNSRMIAEQEANFKKIFDTLYGVLAERDNIADGLIANDNPLIADIIGQKNLATSAAREAARVTNDYSGGYQKDWKAIDKTWLGLGEKDITADYRNMSVEDLRKIVKGTKGHFGDDGFGYQGAEESAGKTTAAKMAISEKTVDLSMIRDTKGMDETERNKYLEDTINLRNEEINKLKTLDKYSQEYYDTTYKISMLGDSINEALDNGAILESDKAKIAEEYDNQIENQRATQQKITDELKAQIQNERTRLDIIKKRTTESLNYQKGFAGFFDGLAIDNTTIQQLEGIKTAYEQLQGEIVNTDELQQTLASNPALMQALDVTAQGLVWNKQKLEELGIAAMNESYNYIQSRIDDMEATKITLEAQSDDISQWSDEAVTQTAAVIGGNNSLVDTQQQNVSNEASNLGLSEQSWINWSDSVCAAIKAAGEEYNKFLESEANKTQQTYTGSYNGSAKVDETVTGEGAATVEDKKTDIAETLKATGYSADKQGAIANINKQIQLLKGLQNSLKYKKSNVDDYLGGDLYDDGGGSEDEYEGMIEKLEHFYNYLRQIEALEAKINKLRERRNLIDATENYYIDDLVEENKLLKEQASLYGNYINDEIEYLAQLRNQLSAAYGDWVYFNDEGVVQVKQTEFAINSEEEEERYNAFSELLEEYQNEYNTMLENQNTLYSIQATIVENINTSYDKILKRITDVAEQLEYINSISEHWVEMSFGSIEKLPLLNDQIKTTADMLLNAQKGVNELNGDFEQLNKTIQNSDFTSLLTWDEELGHYKVNNKAMADPEVRKQFEAQGYNWAEVETWVNATAAASQKITTSMKETNTELMNAREQLKSLLEERISTISEIFEKATEEINKFYGIYEKKIDALGTENDLFGTKSENIDAQYDYLMTVAGHSKSLLDSLKKNNQDILDTLTTDYADYVQMIDGVAYINKMAIEESDTLTEAQKADLLQLYQLYTESQDQIEEVNEKFYDYISQIEELERAKRDAIIDLKNQLHDELMAKDQEEIDELSEKYDKMSALDSEYYSQLQQRISDARNARSRLQEQQDLTQMQNRLSVLQRDNSGQYNSELVDLQRQINERLQAQADQNIDLEMERIAREQQQREEDRQMQITQMENLLTFKDENGIYWQETQAIINNGTASVIGTLMNSESVINSSQEEQYQKLEELQDQAETAAAELGSGKEYIASNFRQDLEKYVKDPVEALDIPSEIQAQADTVSGQIAHGTQVFINTMSALFRLLNEANGKSEAGGYTTGLLDENGIYTPPTKKPVEQPKPSTSTNTSSSNSGAPELKVGNHVEVKPGTKWYYDSYGTSPTGKARSGKIKYINLKGSRPYNIEGLGWIRKEDIQGYNKGGYVDYTGIAAVHGKAGKPEAFLNAKQTALFETLRDALVRVPTMNSKETDNSENITIENLTIDVKQLADTDSVDKIVRTVKQSIYKDATSGNNMKINRR